MTDQKVVPPEISVVVAIIDGGDALRNCLRALTGQPGSDAAEIIVPVDHLTAEEAAMQQEFPGCRFLDLGTVLDGLVPSNALELHRFWDLRQAEGIKTTTGRLVGLVTDRGIPSGDWIAAMIDLHEETGAAAVGGCIDNGYDNVWNWAVHICDFGRYTAPIKTRESEFLSATNVCYRGDELRALRSCYENGFYEPSLHAALRAAGQKLILSDRIRTTERRPRISMRPLLAEWYQWGRKYGMIRSTEISTTDRVLRAIAIPILPFVLYWRHFKTQFRRSIHFGKFCLASPLIFLIMTMWALGEFVGYFEGSRYNAP